MIWKLAVGVTFTCIVVCIVCIVCIAIATVIYGLLFYCKKTMDDYAIYFNDYNSQSKKAIETYGDFRITRAYMIKKPLTKLTVCILNLITMQNNKQVLDDAMHLQLMIEIKINKCEKKMILIDKTNCINILTEFHIDNKYMIIPIKLKKKTTLRGILDKTCDHVGKIKFFNWHIYKNNCHYFIKQLIFQLNSEFKHRCIKCPKISKYFCNKLLGNTSLNIWLLFMFLYNFFQKYIINVKDDIISLIVNLL